MPSLRLTPFALRDLERIVTYLTREAGLNTAFNVEQRLFAACEDLVLYKPLGHHRTDLTSRPVLFHNAFSYQIVFRREADAVVVLAVLHGARDIEDLLRRRPT